MSSTYPDCSVVRRPVRIGGLSKPQLLAQLQKEAIELNAAGRDLFADDRFAVSPSPQTVETVELTVAKPKAADTVRSNILAFEKLQEFALKNGFITKLFEVPEKPEGVRRTRLPTPDEVEAIKTVSNKQFRLAYEALRVCGKSPYLLAKAKVSDWDRKKKIIVIWSGARAGTTSKKREIHVGKRLEELILESLGDRTEGFLFLTPTGLPWTTASLSAAFRRARNQLKLSKEIVLFSARHEHALKMIRAGLDYQDRMDA